MRIKNIHQNAFREVPTYETPIIDSPNQKQAIQFINAEKEYSDLPYQYDYPVTLGSVCSVETNPEYKELEDSSIMTDNGLDDGNI